MDRIPHALTPVFDFKAAYRRWWEETTDTPYGVCWCGCGEYTAPAKQNDARLGYVKGEPTRYRRGHVTYESRGAIDYLPEDRGYETPCWIWQRSIARHGYGQLQPDGRKGRNVGAHRIYYEMAKGPIPEGLHIDHLCRVPACVNPGHLEAVTPAENRRRSPHTRLTAEDVVEMRRLHAAGLATARQLAQRYGISQGYCWRVLNGHRWVAK